MREIRSEEGVARRRSSAQSSAVIRFFVWAFAHRWQPAVVVASASLLLFSFNNCSQPGFQGSADSAVSSEILSDKSLVTLGLSEEPLRDWIGGLDKVMVRDFEVSRSGRELLVEAMDLFPRDLRESGLLKTYHLDLTDQTLTDLCASRPAETQSYDCRMGSLSSEGGVVAVLTKDSLFGSRDRDLFEDIFLIDLSSQARVVFQGGVSGDQIFGTVTEARIGTGGSPLVFVTSDWGESWASEGFRQIYVSSKGERWVRPVSLSLTGELANGHCWNPSLSHDGRWIVFESNATNLLPQVDDGNDHVYAKHLKTGQLIWVDEPLSGSVSREDTHSFQAQVSGDGRYVIFASESENLVAGDNNGFIDVFLKDLRSQSLRRLSLTPSGRQPRGDCDLPAISFDGQFAVFSCDPLAFGLSRNLEASEVFLSLPNRNRLMPLHLPDGQPWKVHKVSLASGGSRLVLGLRLASESSSEPRLSLIRYHLTKRR